MTRYEPHCDCLGGHVSMVPDPNGRWCRADEGGAVADDPSGIVQQMPEGDLAELRASIPAGPWTAHRSHPLNACTYVCAGEWNREVATLYGCFDDVKQPDKGQPWPNHPIREATARAIALLPDLLDEVITRRATEADLRAEVERLRAALKPFASAWRIARASGLTSMVVLGQLARNEVAAVSFLRASAALYPETDGGQDG